MTAPLVYRDEVGKLVTDCPVPVPRSEGAPRGFCSQTVVCHRRGDSYQFECRGGHSHGEIVALLDPAVMLDLGRAENGTAPAASGGDPPWRALVVDGAAFALDAPTVVPAVWGRGDQVLWAEGEPAALVGPQGVGKTTITHNDTR